MILEVRNLHRIYNGGLRELHVLRGIDLEVEENQALTIVGPSGAGKSTLLHILGGLDEPTEGEVFFKGVNLYKIDEDRRARIRNSKIGFVFQFYHLLPEFTALENVLLPAWIRFKSAPKEDSLTKSKIKNRAYDLLLEVGLRDRIAHRPNQLSGGEQQRVAIARALMNSPDLLLCDEPTGNLDSETSKDICELLRRLKRMGRQTLIIVTHEEEIARGSDRVIRIRDGRLV